MQTSEYAQAVTCFQRAYAIMKARFFFVEVPMPVLPRMVEAALGPNWHQGKHAEACDLRTAKKFARRGQFFALSFPNIRPRMLRASARLNFALGKKAKAKKLFERAIAEADKLGAKYDHARALYDSNTAFPENRSRKQQAQEILEAIRAVMPQTELL